MASVKNLLIKLRLIGGKKTKDDLKGVDKGIKSIGKSALKVGAGFFAARGLITGLTRSIELAGRFEKVEKGFNNLAKSAGFSSQALEKLTKATDGTMSSIQLMTQANNAMLLGIVESEDQMADLFDISQRLASALGKDTTFGIESMVTGLGRQSKLMLDNLGIMVDTNGAYEDYAENLGVTVGQLSDQQKKQAFVNAAMTTANSLVAKLGIETMTTADHISQMKTALIETQIALGKDWAPVVEKAAGLVTRFSEKLLKGKESLEFFFGVTEKGKENIEAFRKEIESVIASGNLEEIQASIIRAQKTLEKFPRSAKELSPIIKNLQEAADALRETTQGADIIVNTISLSAKAAENLAKFTAQTSTSLLVSAAMGDSMTEAFKRALFQQVLITMQLKIQDAIQKRMAAMQAVGGGPVGWLMGAANFLFGASPTQVAPSANVASGSKIVINNNISGFGTIDSNFASNSLIPAINKAISTGQARIG